MCHGTLTMRNCELPCMSTVREGRVSQHSVCCRCSELLLWVTYSQHTALTSRRIDYAVTACCCHCDLTACRYGHNPTIASVSFGAPRDFILRHNTERTRKISTTLSAGDVLIMSGTTQQHWQHSIPKRKGVMQPRINLTFRTIVGS